MRRFQGVFAVALLASVAVGCGLGGPEQTATTTTTAPEPVVYSAIGGDATVERDPDALRRRRLHAPAVPPPPAAQTVFTDLARPGATVVDASDQQLPTALDLGTTIATVWFERGDLGAPLADAEAQLADLIGQLVGSGAEVGVTSGTRSDSAWDEAVARVASTTGATAVDLEGARDQADIADRFAAALGLPA